MKKLRQLVYVKFETNILREEYRAGTLFNIGDKVTDGSDLFEIVSRGPNYITVVNESGDMSKKWLDAVYPTDIEEDIKPGYAPKQISYKGYTTKNFNRSEDAAKAFKDTINRVQDPVAVLNAIKATDTYMGINDKFAATNKFTDEDKATWIAAHNKARESLMNVGEFMHHEDYWHTHQHELETLIDPYKKSGKADLRAEGYTQGLTEMKFSPADKIKVAKIVASSLGLEDKDEKSSAETMVNKALHKIKNKTLNKESWKIIANMLRMASDAGIEYDESIIANRVEEAVLVKDTNKNNQSDQEAAQPDTPTNDKSKVGNSLGGSTDAHRRMKVKYCLGEEAEENPLEKEEEELDLSDEEIDAIISNISDDDYLEAYEDEELALVDDETGEHVSELKEDVIMEVLSRTERIRAKIRFAKTATKRERRIRIALKTHSTTKTINGRARKLAIITLKKKLAKKPLDKLSVGEKERIERIVSRKKILLNKMAMKLAPKVRKIENDRLSHRSYTKG